jgi:hypothetical protein
MAHGESPDDLTYAGETANLFLSRCSPDILTDERLIKLLNFPMPSVGKDYLSLVGRNIAAGNVKLESICPDVGRDEDPKLNSLYLNYDHYYTGFHAVQRMMLHIKNGLFQVKPDIKYTEVRALFKGLVHFYQESTFIAPSAWNEGMRDSPLDLQNERMERFAEGLRRVIHAGNRPSYRNHEGWVDPFSEKLPELSKWLNIQKGAFEIYKLRNLLLFASRKDKGLQSELIVLSFKDQTKLLYQLEACSKWIEYGRGLASVYKLDENLCFDFLKWVYDVIDRCPSHLMFSLCKQFKVMHTWLVARFLGSQSAAIAIHHRSLLDEGVWKDVFKCDDICDTLVKIPLIASLGLSQVYRIFSMPDVDERKAMADLESYHRNPRVLPQDEESVAMREMVWNYADRQLMVSIRKWAGVYPGKPRGEVDENSPEWVQRAHRGEKADIPLDFQLHWDIDGSLPYAARTDTYYELVKDKACTYDHIESVNSGAEYAKLPSKEVNSLVKLLKETEPPDMDKIKRDIEREADHTTVKVALKAERHKPYSRPYFIQKDRYKNVLSESEENVERVARRVTGYGISQGGIQFLEKVRRMTSLHAEKVMYKAFYLSFDLEKFSPRMAVATRKRMYERWARLFGQPWMKGLFKVCAKTTVKFMNFRTTIQYESLGNDYEGMNAKQNTELHPAVMATCIRFLRLRKPKLTAEMPPGMFDAFIDDGALALMFPIEHYDELRDEFLKIVDKVYKSIGWEISWEKTYLSDHGFVYLNRMFSHGKEVHTGIKAFMKIAVVHENSTESIVDRLDTLKGRFLGALEAGCPPIQTYWVYFKEFVKEIRRWDRSIPLDSVLVLPLFIAPVSLGGFGLTSLFGATVNIGESAVSSGVDFLYATKSESLLGRANFFLSREPREKKAVDTFRNPKTITIDGAYLRSARMMSEAQKVVIDVMENPTLKSLHASVDYLKTEVMLSALLKNSGGSMAIPLMEKIWSTMPEKYLEDFISKFRRSKSIAELIGRDTITKIREQNKADVKSVINSYFMSMK